jgi:glycosyltransferase involved in cell wall biosynthesis
MGALARPIFTLASPLLRLWDAACADRVDYFVANSATVAGRIRKHYRRDAAVIHPPVKIKDGFLADRIDDYYMTAGQLVAYKRIDLAIAACNRLGRRLHVVGEGEQYRALRRLAGPTIVFCGALSDQDLFEQYAHCRALLFPGEEDFGMVPVEAMSCGRPVIAYARGGATETVRGITPGLISGPAPSGVFFQGQTVDALDAAIETFEQFESAFVPAKIQKSVERFDESHFRRKLADFLAEKLAEFRGTRAP